MLAFITSLRHPRNSADYGRVELLLRQTLTSLTAQDNRDFRVFVVGNRLPQFELPPAVQFLPVDFPPPTDMPGPQTGREAVLRDKGTKLAVGLLAAAGQQPCHLMFVDADDYVSRRLAGLAAACPQAPGWVINDGYVYSASSQLVKPVDRFNERCGSSLLLRSSLFDLPDLPLTSTQDELIDGFGEFTIRDLFGSHRAAVAHFADAGNPLTPVPFPGAVYRVDTGENHSGASLAGFGRPVSGHLHREFGLAVSSSDPQALAASARSAARMVGIVGRAVGRRLRASVLS